MAFSPAPIDVEEVLNAEWLSAALSEGREPVRVRAFEVVETLGPSALKIRIKLDFDGAPPADVPDRICIKGIFDRALTQWLASGAQQAEANFYRILAPRLSVRVPRALYSGFDPETMADTAGVLLKYQDDMGSLTPSMAVHLVAEAHATAKSA